MTTLHMIKLCVGVSDVETLERNAARSDWRIVHTRMTPKRAAEIEDGGSLYWVIKGQVAARQRLLDLRTFTGADGIQRCELVLGPEVIETASQPKRPFQGWRYLKSDEAPKDLGALGEDVAAMPEDLRRELTELGLL